jgi:membrane peptidoglycan carboxypeptidase
LAITTRMMRRLSTALCVGIILSGCAVDGPFDGLVTLSGPGFELTPQPEARPSTIVAADGTVLATLRREYRDRVSLQEMPQVLIAAVLAAEDQRFYDHQGLDARALARAAARNIAAGQVVEGGSTISQQLVELRFLPPTDDTILTKAAKAALALQLEEDFPKEWILEEYLNTVYLGGGAHGVGAASWTYFRSAPQDLSNAQAALIAGLIRTPGSADPRAALADALDDADDPAGAIITLDPATGAITASVSSLPYSELQFDLATQAIR